MDSGWLNSGSHACAACTSQTTVSPVPVQSSFTYILCWRLTHDHPSLPNPKVRAYRVVTFLVNRVLDGEFESKMVCLQARRGHMTARHACSLRFCAYYLPSLPPSLACSLSFSSISSVILRYLFRVVSSGTSVWFSILLPGVCDGSGGQPVCLRPNHSGHYWKVPNQRLWQLPTKLNSFKRYFGLNWHSEKKPDSTVLVG